MSDDIYQKLCPKSLASLNAYKTKLKKVLIDMQGSGNQTEWQCENFLLHNIKGLRKSERNVEIVNYTQYYQELV